MTTSGLHTYASNVARTLCLLVMATVLGACASQPPVRSVGMASGIPQTRIDYGRVTAVQRVELRNQDSQAAGALVGGLLGVASGSGQSASNRALRGLGGAAVGSRVGGAAGSSTAFEFTVLLNGTNTLRFVTEKSGLRVGDCVSLERGQFNNIRLAPDERCEIPAATPPQAAISEADACAAATQQLLDAATDEEFERAERRMRILCN
jgi:outer membrane lipoprotein SlyB